MGLIPEITFLSAVYFNNVKLSLMFRSWLPKIFLSIFSSDICDLSGYSFNKTKDMYLLDNFAEDLIIRKSKP